MIFKVLFNFTKTFIIQLNDHLGGSKYSEEFLAKNRITQQKAFEAWKKNR